MHGSELHGSKLHGSTRSAALNSINRSKDRRVDHRHAEKQAVEQTRIRPTQARSPGEHLDEDLALDRIAAKNRIRLRLSSVETIGTAHHLRSRPLLRNQMPRSPSPLVQREPNYRRLRRPSHLRIRGLEDLG